METDREEKIRLANLTLIRAQVILPKEPEYGWSPYAKHFQDRTRDSATDVYPDAEDYLSE